MVNNVAKPKKKPPRPSREGQIPKIHPRKLFTLRSLGIILLFLFSLYFISPGLRLRWTKFKEGEAAEKSIFAQVEFEVEDLEATKRAREQAARLAPPVYALDHEVVDSSLAAAKEQFDKIGKDALNPVFTREEREALLSKYMRDPTSEATIELLAAMEPEEFQELRSDAVAIIEDVLKRGVLSDVPGSARQIFIYDKLDKQRRLVEVSNLLTMKRVSEVVEQRTANEYPDRPGYQQALKELTLPFLKNTLIFDEKLTQIAQEDSRDLVEPVTTTFIRNQEIVQKGHKVTVQDLLELQAHARALSRTNKLQAYLGNALLLLMVFAGFLYYLRRYRPEIHRNDKALLLIGILVFLTLVTGRVLIFLPIPDAWLFLVPVAAGGILLSTLLDDRLAIVYTFFISLLYAAQGDYRFELFVVGALGSLAGIYYTRSIRKRSDIFWPGIVVSGVNMVAIVALRLVGVVEDEFLGATVAGASNGLITAIGVVPGSLIWLESVSGIATNIRLLELSDLNHPLLKKLAMQAPGTYHHSLMVGNMAEAAAEQIGANSLLARVGSYYHDVGKINKPLYYSENQLDGRNKHDELTPTMSALVLAAHVKEGVELAREYRLNQPILEFIQQHHGTSLMPYFYQKALELNPDKNVKEENFRYPGPNPQSREVAICMLADSVEAASRTLVNPTHGRIKGMVEKIINNKFVDSQLDECDLTLKDLHKIADSFVRVLASYLHSRVEYPEEQTTKEIKEKFEGMDTKVGAKAPNKARSNSRGG